MVTLILLLAMVFREWRAELADGWNAQQVWDAESLDANSPLTPLKLLAGVYINDSTSEMW